MVAQLTEICAVIKRIEGMRVLEADRHSLDIALLIELPSDTAFVCMVSHSAVIWALIPKKPQVNIYGSPKPSETDLQPSGKTVRASCS